MVVITMAKQRCTRNRVPVFKGSGLGLPLLSCVILDKSLNLSRPLFSHLQNGSSFVQHVLHDCLPCVRFPKYPTCVRQRASCWGNSSESKPDASLCPQAVSSRQGRETINKISLKWQIVLHAQRNVRQGRGKGSILWGATRPHPYRMS